MLGSRETLGEELLDRTRDVLPSCSDSPYFVGQCVVNKTYPLVFESLRPVAGGNNGLFVPATIAGFRRLCLHRWRPRWFRWQERFEQVRRILAVSGCDFAFIRGLPFGARYYDRPWLRVCTDIDLLIRESQVKIVEQAFLDCGFVYSNLPEERAACAAYLGQVAFKHPYHVDVNWQFPGSDSTGPLRVDMDAVWERAQPLEKSEYELSAEDAILDLIRHTGHGHYFENGVIRCCADVLSVLRRCGDNLDWDYFGRRAEQSRCRRAVSLFGYFYDHYYLAEKQWASMHRIPGKAVTSHRTPNFPEEPLTLTHKTSCSNPCISKSEAKLFSLCVVWPQIRLGVKGNGLLPSIARRNLMLAAMGFATDRLTGLLRLLRIAVWPCRQEVFLFLDESYPGTMVRGRLLMYLLLWLPLFPGLCLGCAARLACAFVSGLRAWFCRLPKAPE